MKFGIRTPSLKRRFAARTSWKRVVRHSIGLKAPRGMGFFTNPKRALYNRVYNRTSASVDSLLKTSKTPSVNATTSAHKFSGSFWVNTIIFLVLTAVFFPLGIGFLIYKLYRYGKKQSPPSVSQRDSAIVPTSQEENSPLT